MSNVVEIILKGTDKSSAAFKSAGKEATIFQKSIKGIGVAAGVAAGAVAAFALDAVKLAARVETLAVVTKILGENAGYSEKRIRAFEDAIVAQGITMRAARQSVAQMIQSNIDLTKSTELATMAQNAAVIAGTDSSEAFSRLVTTIQSGNVEMGRTMGLALNFGQAYQKSAGEVGRTAESLTEAEKAIIRTNHLLDQGTNIAGAYGAAMETAGKQITSFPRYIEEIKVAAGDVLLPVWTKLVFGTKEWVTGLRDLIEAKNELREKVERLTDAGWDEATMMDHMFQIQAGLIEGETSMKEEKFRLIRVMDTEIARWNAMAEAMGLIPPAAEGLDDVTDKLKELTEAQYYEMAAEALLAGNTRLAQHYVDMATKTGEARQKVLDLIAALEALDGKSVSYSMVGFGQWMGGPSWQDQGPRGPQQTGGGTGIPEGGFATFAAGEAAGMQFVNGKWVPKAGGQHGLDMIIPPGYSGDSYTVGANSGERVRVETPAQQRAGDNNSRSFNVTNYISTEIDDQSFQDRFKRMVRG